MMGREKARERDDWEILCRKAVSEVEKSCAVVCDSPLPPSHHSFLHHSRAARVMKTTGDESVNAPFFES